MIDLLVIAEKSERIKNLVLHSNRSNNYYINFIKKNLKERRAQNETHPHTVQSNPRCNNKTTIKQQQLHFRDFFVYVGMLLGDYVRVDSSSARETIVLGIRRR